MKNFIGGFRGLSNSKLLICPKIKKDGPFGV